jgi:hypothetical protein
LKNLPKKIYILAPITIMILTYFTVMYNYRKPITVHKIFNEAIITKPGSLEVLKETSIEINAKLHRGLYRGSILDFNAHFTNELEGEIIIDNKRYNFRGFTEKSNINNIIGTVHEKNQVVSDGFMFKMYDLDSIELISMRKTQPDYRIFAPAQTIEDYQHIENKINNIKR